MAAVLVHGNPETPAVWDSLRAELSREDVVTLQLPGFGVPAPEGFEATKDGYVGWLVGELEAIGKPGRPRRPRLGRRVRAARGGCTRPDLIRSWVSDVAGLLHPEYVWHDFARIWQTPVPGEQWVSDTVAQPKEARAESLVAAGVTRDAALTFAEALDEEMGRCILALYRSAAQPAMHEWGRDVARASSAPGW